MEIPQGDEQCGTAIPAIDELDLPILASYLSNFILEVRKKNGDEFPPNSLHHNIVSGLQRHLRFNGKPAVDFLVLLPHRRLSIPCFS
jgi:hypothetical protein